MRAGHGVFAGGEGAEEPVDFLGFEAHVDFDGGAAGDGGAEAAADFVEGGGAEFAFGDFEDFEDDFFDVGGADAGRRRFDGDGALAERFGLEAVGVEFVGDAGVFEFLARC